MFNGLLRMSPMGMVRYGTVRNGTELMGACQKPSNQEGDMLPSRDACQADTLLFRWQAEPFEYSD